MRFSGDFSAIIRIVNDEIGIAAHLDRSFAWKESEKLRRLRARSVDEPLEVQLSAFHAVREIKIDSVFQGRNSVWNFGEIIFAHLFLGEIERRMISSQG